MFTDVGGQVIAMPISQRLPGDFDVILENF